MSASRSHRARQEPRERGETDRRGVGAGLDVEMAADARQRVRARAIASRDPAPSSSETATGSADRAGQADRPPCRCRGRACTKRPAPPGARSTRRAGHCPALSCDTGGKRTVRERSDVRKHEAVRHRTPSAGTESGSACADPPRGTTRNAVPDPDRATAPPSRCSPSRVAVRYRCQIGVEVVGLTPIDVVRVQLIRPAAEAAERLQPIDECGLGLRAAALEFVLGRRRRRRSRVELLDESRRRAPRATDRAPPSRRSETCSPSSRDDCAAASSVAIRARGSGGDRDATSVRWRAGRRPDRARHRRARRAAATATPDTGAADPRDPRATILRRCAP